MNNSRSEEHLLEKKQKEIYANKIIDFILKMAVYFDTTFCLEEAAVRRFKKFEGVFEIKTLKVKKIKSILYKLIISDEAFKIEFRNDDTAITVGLYSTAVFSENKEIMSFIENLLTSKELFLRKADE